MTKPSNNDTHPLIAGLVVRLAAQKAENYVWYLPDMASAIIWWVYKKH